MLMVRQLLAAALIVAGCPRPLRSSPVLDRCWLAVSSEWLRRSTIRALGIGMIGGLACCPDSFAQGLSPPRSIKVAAVDFVPAWGDLDGNVRRLAQAAEGIARQ